MQTWSQVVTPTCPEPTCPSWVTAQPASRVGVLTSELRVDTTNRPVLQDDLTNSYSLVTA